MLSSRRIHKIVIFILIGPSTCVGVWGNQSVKSSFFASCFMAGNWLVRMEPHIKLDALEFYCFNLAIVHNHILHVAIQVNRVISFFTNKLTHK